MSNSDKWRPPNAHQHGVFSRTTILPGENPDEFEELYSDLIKEWAPFGATEEDAVLSIAKAIWRKRRAQKFIGIRVNNNSVNPQHPSYDEHYVLSGYVDLLRSRPNIAEKYAKVFLRDDTLKSLMSKVSQAEFKTTREWAKAAITEIESVMLPRALPMAQMTALCLSAESFTDDVFDKELRLDERLDVMIDRAVKRLVQTKAMKQMFGQIGTDPAEDRVTKIAVK